VEGAVTVEHTLREENARLSMLADITNAVTSTLDSREALRRLARLVVPRLGDWCAVDLYLPPQHVERVAVVHRDHEQTPPGRYERVLPPLVDDSDASLAWVLRGAPAVLLRDVQAAADTTTALGREQHALFTELGADTAIVAPLRGRRGNVLGAVTVVRLPGATPLTAHDLPAVEEVARRAALAVENARLYDAQRDIAENMQRSLLPTLPVIDHLKFAARYLPARRSAEVGGDWYDVFLLPRGDTALIIGDVMGHDIDAAVRMGQLRNMLRALACDRDETPASVLQRLDRLVTHLQVAQAATATYAIIDGPVGGPWRLRWSNAGHPPPLLVTAEGAAQFLSGDPDLLLGASPDVPRRDEEHALPPRSTLLFYTDGLIEGRSASVDAGMDWLARQVSARASDAVDAIVDCVVSEVPMPFDDVAVLAVRIPAAGEGAK